MELAETIQGVKRPVSTFRGARWVRTHWDLLETVGVFGRIDELMCSLMSKHQLSHSDAGDLAIGQVILEALPRVNQALKVQGHQEVTMSEFLSNLRRWFHFDHGLIEARRRITRDGKLVKD